jgi:hypothetical protein
MLSTAGCHLSPQHHSSQNISPSQNLPSPTQPLQHQSPLCPNSPKSHPQNPPTTQPLQHHSPQHPLSPKSPPQNTLPSQNPPPQNSGKDVKKEGRDANVNEPSIDISTLKGSIIMIHPTFGHIIAKIQ